MPAAITDKLTQPTNGTRPSPTTLTSIKLVGASSISCNALTGWPTATAVHFIIYNIDTNNKKVAGSQTDWKGIATGTTITNLTLQAGTDTQYSIGAVVEAAPTAMWGKDLVDGILTQHNQDGTHAAITSPSAVFSGNVTAANFIQTGGASANGWTVGLATPNTVTYNGNRNYSLVFNGTDLTGTLSNGMRLRATRTVTAPTQCTSLNGTTQYYSKAAPAGMTFTNNFVVSAWVKASSYASGSIASRFDGTNGWDCRMEVDGRITIAGYNAGSANGSQITSYQSIPLNKWIHVAAQLDMATFTATTTTSYVMIDGVDVPGSVTRSGTNPTALIQAGNLNIGARNAAQFFTGKVAQVAIYSAKVTQATILASISQTLIGTETSLISAYTFNNSINDLNANANNLTANGSAVATNADSPFAGGANATSGVAAGTLEYGEVFDASFSTNTTVVVQVPDGYLIPTTGGVSAFSYSTQGRPYGWPGLSTVLAFLIVNTSSSTTSASATAVPGLTTTVYVPKGRKVKVKHHAGIGLSSSNVSFAASISVCKTTAADANRIAQVNTQSGTNSTAIAENTDIATGFQTYIGAFSVGGGNTVTIAGATIAPNFLSIELEPV